MNLKRIQFFLTWFKVSMKLISIKLKWSIAMICYNKPALWKFDNHNSQLLSISHVYPTNSPSSLSLPLFPSFILFSLSISLVRLRNIISMVAPTEFFTWAPKIYLFFLGRQKDLLFIIDFLLLFLISISFHDTQNRVKLKTT